LAIIANHQELLSIIFGAKFVFKLLSKYAFEITVENSQKNPPYLAFTSKFKIYAKFLVGP
jgi:hypothetical protein